MNQRACILKYIGKMVVCVGCLYSLVGCQNDNSMKVIEHFIHTQINSETYEEAKGDEVQLKESFKSFFIKDGYEKYLEDMFGYMYPLLFDITHAEQVKVEEIKCEKVKKLEDGEQEYEVKVAYTIIPHKKEEEDRANMNMVDRLLVTLNKEDKIVQVIILNTSDVINKLILDVKIQ